MKIEEIRKITYENVTTVPGCGAVSGKATDKPAC